MLLKKPTAALCSSSGVLYTLYFPSLFSLCRARDNMPTAPSLHRGEQRHSYATAHEGQRADRHNTTDHPKWPTSSNPTPYEILGLSRDHPYSKARYFQLAKLYHPDRQQHTADDGIPHVTKLERYRLVVAANEILSNPQKKRMYDLYGFGWENQADPQTRYREADRAWRQAPGSPSMNATWEDWEQWQRQRNGTGEKQEEVFTSNIAFMAIVAAFLIVGTWSQMTRAGTNSVSLLEMRDQKHAAISKELQEIRSQRARLNREARVENFVRQRDLEKWAHDPPGHALPPSGDSEGSN
ncbi:hypothetical protein C7999DRAFT_15290 [Corynascus novoguineensis]|uniref:J domain-containing protein n=1 Tax=Corynascus novoguineensis TaxID=1126955 RepID=A0AAN7CRA8_9PEZI|nr:hypothetical protein C7999DRAFT_15290 [Corynascus novoguineensis]